MPGTREAERCTDVTNAVVGKADGAAVLVELTPPLMGWEGGSGQATSAEIVRRDEMNRVN